MTVLDDLVCDAEDRWLKYWIEGPTEPFSQLLRRGDRAPDATLLDETGQDRRLSDFWSQGPALVIFWRHFGCGCGLARASRLTTELADYRDAGLDVVVVGQGEPERALAYKQKYSLDVPVLTDPTLNVYRAYGVGQWQPEQVLFDAPPEFWTHTKEVGEQFLVARRDQGRPLVDDPWRATAEFVISTGGTVRLSYAYQYCEDFPDPRVLTTAGRLAAM